MFDGVMLARKTSAGVIRRPVLVALICAPTAEGGHRFPPGAGERCRRALSAVLIRRGLVGDRLEMICLDGGAGLFARCRSAIRVPVRRCWAQDRNVLAKAPRRPAGHQGRPARGHECPYLAMSAVGSPLPTAGWPIIRGPSCLR
jgi:hypothetical protein